MTKGRIKQLSVKWVLMMSPVWIVGLVMVWHPHKAQAYVSPTLYRIMWYPDCSPAWAGGTIWKQGIDVPNSSSGIATGPYCDGPVYMPELMPQSIGSNPNGVMVIDTTTNYCGQGDILMGFSYTEEETFAFGIPTWYPVAGTTNQVVMPNGYTRAEWGVIFKTITNFVGRVEPVPMLGPAIPLVSCPGGVGTGGQ